MVPKDSGNNVFSCVACGEFIPNCKACSLGNSIYSCIDCEESYYTYRGLCIKCSPNCSQCTESSCTLCESGYQDSSLFKVLSFEWVMFGLQC